MVPEVGLSGLLLDYPFSGSAVYTRNLVSLLPRVDGGLRFRLYLRRASELFPGMASERLATPFKRLGERPGPGARLDKLAWEVLALPLAATARRNALLHSLYFAAPAVSPCPVVVTIHDLIPLVLPAYHRTRQSSLYSHFMAFTAKRAAAIITVSDCSKRDIVRVLGVDERRVHVTYEAVDGRFRPESRPEEAEHLRRKYDLPPRFLLYTGGAERRKNLELLVRAWAREACFMREQGVGLVLVAHFPPPDLLYPDIPRLASELGLDRDIVFVPRVEEDDKPALYRAALAFCFPSQYEGFGFTPLEAMASGLPVIASDAASLPEVIGQGGLLLPPNDVGAWAESMRCVVDSARTRQTLVQRGLSRARRFSWRRTAEQTVQVYLQVLGA